MLYPKILAVASISAFDEQSSSGPLHKDEPDVTDDDLSSLTVSVVDLGKLTPLCGYRLSVIVVVVLSEGKWMIRWTDCGLWIGGRCGVVV